MEHKVLRCQQGVDQMLCNIKRSMLFNSCPLEFDMICHPVKLLRGGEAFLMSKFVIKIKVMRRTG